MRCGKAQRLMAAQVAGELREAEVKDLEGHLSACPRCREAFAVYRASFAALRQSRVREAPEEVLRNFWPEVRRRLPKAAPTAGDPSTMLRVAPSLSRGETLRGFLEQLRVGWFPKAAGAVGAAAALMLLVWVFFAGGPAKVQGPGRVIAPPPGPGQVVEPLAPSELAKLPAGRRGVVRVTPIARLPRGLEPGRRFFVLPPLDSPRLRAPGADIDVLNSASLAEKGGAYALPSARLVSTDE